MTVTGGDPDELRARLASRGTALVTVATGSMAPTLHPGDSVTVSRRDPEAGDVALIAGRRAVTLHRLIVHLPSPIGRWVHAGDAPGAASGLCRDDQILAVADLPRRLAVPLTRARLSLIALGRAAIARVLAAALLLVLAAAALGCKPKVAPPPAAPRIVDVKVVDRSGANSPLDTVALARRAAQVMGEASGLTVSDGGVPEGGAFKLRIEVRAEGGAGEGGRPMVRAMVDVRLLPQGGTTLLSYEQTAVAERARDGAPAADGGSPLQALVDRAVSDVLRGVGARVKLASADEKTLGAALDGADDDLRLEALRVAGERHLRPLVPAIVRLLKSEDRDVRDRAVGTLASLGDTRAVKPLTEVARFSDHANLPMVLDALAAIGGDEARAYLEFVASGHEDPGMRELAKKSLTYLESRAHRDLGAPPR